MALLRDAIEIAKRGGRVVYFVPSRSAARRVKAQLVTLDFNGVGSVDVVSIEDMPRPGRPFSNPVVIDEIRHMTPAAYEYLVSKIDAKAEPAGHAACSPQPRRDRPQDPPLERDPDDHPRHDRLE